MPPARSQQQRNGQLTHLQPEIDVQQVVDQNNRKRPGKNHERDHAEDQPDILPAPRSRELHGQHAVACHQASEHRQGNAVQRIVSHLAPSPAIG